MRARKSLSSAALRAVNPPTMTFDSSAYGDLFGESAGLVAALQANRLEAGQGRAVAGPRLKNREEALLRLVQMPLREIELAQRGARRPGRGLGAARGATAGAQGAAASGANGENGENGDPGRLCGRSARRHRSRFRLRRRRSLQREHGLGLGDGRLGERPSGERSVPERPERPEPSEPSEPAGRNRSARSPTPSPPARPLRARRAPTWPAQPARERRCPVRRTPRRCAARHPAGGARRTARRHDRRRAPGGANGSRLTAGRSAIAGRSKSASPGSGAASRWRRGFRGFPAPPAALRRAPPTPFPERRCGRPGARSLRRGR